jgi:arginine decarboxylase
LETASPRPTLTSDPDTWTPADAEALYHVPAWGEGYVSVTDEGQVAIRPAPDGPPVSVHAVVEELVGQGVRLPLVVRFQDLLATRVRLLNESFRAAIGESGYGNGYTGVYPVKVNQLREVVDEIVEAGKPYGYGLECGSKTELIATLPRLEDDETLLLVNGYKDIEMLRLITTFQRLGRQVLPIVEKTTELRRILALADDAGVPPQFGLRVKLSTVADGMWTTSSGDLSKFGVSLPELVDAVDGLIASGHTRALRLLHFHIGSQIGDIQALKAAVRELTRIYAHLTRRGLEIEYLDCGGGLGVNYDALPLGGGRGGVDYSMQEYANAIVYAVQEVCAAEDVPPPRIVTENGRAVTAHHSVLVVDTLGRTEKPTVADDFELPAGSHEVAAEMHAMLGAIDEARGLGELLEVYHDAADVRAKAEALFGYGYLALGQKALAERLFWTVCRRLHDRVQAASPDWVPDELTNLGDALTDQLLCDFSVFQSLMDHWALGQRFPIVPLDRLGTRPTRRARLVDLTCDSDGKVARYIGGGAEQRALDVHDVADGDAYRIGIFLVGAYQDILGDAHNLFGGVSEAHVYADADEPGGYYIEETLTGTTVKEMLARVQYFPSDLQRRVQKTLRQKAAAGVVRPKEAQTILDQYRAFFDSTTYLDADLRG